VPLAGPLGPHTTAHLTRLDDTGWPLAARCDGAFLKETEHAYRRTPDAGRPSHLRSRVTNRSKLLEGVDGRRATARRFRDLIDDFTTELGDDLSPAEHLLVRLAATTFLRVETLQAAVANLIRNVNAGARIVRELREAKAKRKSSGPSPLQAWLDARAEADEAEAE
jgi:hypothetical protein